MQEGVDAAVGGRDNSQDLNAPVQVVVALAVMQGEKVFKSGEEKGNIVGSPHQKENSHYGKNKLGTSRPPLPRPSYFSHSYIAKDKNAQWKKKSQNVHF